MASRSEKVFYDQKPKPKIFFKKLDIDVQLGYLQLHKHVA